VRVQLIVLLGIGAISALRQTVIDVVLTWVNQL
jgi:hypothetical protein